LIYGESVMFSLEEAYSQGIKLIRNIVEDIRFGRKLYLNNVLTYANQMCKYLNDTSEILTLLNKMQGKNPYMHSHSVNVALISYVIGKWLDFDNDKLENLFQAGLLHDIGKAKIKDSILNKEDALTWSEMELLKAHPITAYRLLASVNIFNPQVLQAVAFHHERMDGTGYPLEIKQDKINIYSRIIAIADIYDAITSVKAYHERKSPLQALEEIKESSIDKLDPYICEIFIYNVVEYFIGRTIRLSNEQTGIIANISPNAMSKPTICCDDKYLDLSLETELEIVEYL